MLGLNMTLRNKPRGVQLLLIRVLFDNVEDILQTLYADSDSHLSAFFVYF